MEPESATQQLPQTAEQICNLFKCSPEACQLEACREAPPVFFRHLMEKGLYRDAIQFVAHLLPKREAIWWACQCVWLAVRPNPSKEVAAALEAAVRWVLDPSEENRRRAEQAGRAAGSKTPAGSLALAAFWSGGSISRPDLPEAKAPPLLTAQTVAAALLMAAAQAGTPDRVRARQGQFLTLAIEVDNIGLPS